MANYKAGDIVIGAFPFTDKEASKRRMFLIIATPHPFLWGLMITSQFNYDNGFKYPISKNEIDFEMHKDSIICCNVLQTVDPKICGRVLGEVTSECLERIMDIVLGIIKPT